MPELPEVETTRLGIAPHVLAASISNVIVRNPDLRWPVPDKIDRLLRGQSIHKLGRRGKYLIFDFDRGHLLLHLGMSGSLLVVPADSIAGPHDHFELRFDSGVCLRLRDPRRFGSVHYLVTDVMQHPLLAGLGPEPLDDVFSGDYLYERSRNRRQAIKTFIMDTRIVAGVGNIYASEALFEAGIHPARAAGRITHTRYERLADSIKSVLNRAIACGGTTLRDFTTGEGRPGYFRQELKAYDREGEPCFNCSRPLRLRRIGQRSTFYCTHCQH